MEHTIPVYLEVGRKRTFAGALEWPGWSRGGRGEDEALEALVRYGPRYAGVVGGARPLFRAPPNRSALVVVERLAGGSGTDFGVPAMTPEYDTLAVDEASLTRLHEVLTACWSAFDRAAASAQGIELRKGPRGGGRDLAKIVGHVREAEEAYLAQLGARPPKPAGDEAMVTTRLREVVLDALEARARGRPIAQPRQTRTPWTPRYFVRRAGWHILDHAWEIEDRASDPLERSAWVQES